MTGSRLSCECFHHGLQLLFRRTAVLRHTGSRDAGPVGLPGRAFRHVENLIFHNMAIEFLAEAMFPLLRKQFNPFLSRVLRWRKQHGYGVFQVEQDDLTVAAPYSGPPDPVKQVWVPLHDAEKRRAEVPAAQRLRVQRLSGVGTPFDPVDRVPAAGPDGDLTLLDAS